MSEDRHFIEKCAAAMGLQGSWCETPFTPQGHLVFFAAEYDSPQTAPYNPLRQDDQAMALVKKFKLALYNNGVAWWATFASTNCNKNGVHSDLNRAIVECVSMLTPDAAGESK